MRPPKNALSFALGLAAAASLPLLASSKTDDGDLVRSFSRTVQRTAKAASPAVVSVEVSFRNSRRTGEGSGVILSADGLVVTNYHVAGRADSIQVRLSDGRRLDARLKGSDFETDLAVLQIDSKEKFEHLELRDDLPSIGEYVLAIGNPLGYDQTVTSGIISASGRRIGVATYENFLQTDAAINPGNSGGPLVDLDGKVVGIITALENLQRGSQGLGFAIPADMVRDVVGEILDKGRVERGFMGVTVGDISPAQSSRIGLDESPHVVIREIVDQGPADLAGLRSGDVILMIDGQRVDETYDVLETVAEVDPGETVSVRLWRDGRRVDVDVRVERRPELRFR